MSDLPKEDNPNVDLVEDLPLSQLPAQVSAQEITMIGRQDPQPFFLLTLAIYRRLSPVYSLFLEMTRVYYFPRLVSKMPVEMRRMHCFPRLVRRNAGLQGSDYTPIGA